LPQISCKGRKRTLALPLNSLFSEKCNSLKWPCEHIAESLYSEPQMKSIDVILSTFWINYQRERKRRLEFRWREK